jgi:hypothetical protein
MKCTLILSGYPQQHQTNINFSSCDIGALPSLSPLLSVPPRAQFSFHRIGGLFRLLNRRKACNRSQVCNFILYFECLYLYTLSVLTSATAPSTALLCIWSACQNSTLFSRRTRPCPTPAVSRAPCRCVAMWRTLSMYVLPTDPL